jgi:hypothetical protein
MSENSSPVTAEHFNYLAGRTTQEDVFLRSLKAAARADGIPPIWISPEQGSFIQILLMSTGAREVIEVGTLAGYLRKVRGYGEHRRHRGPRHGKEKDIPDLWRRRFFHKNSLRCNLTLDMDS